MLGMLGGMSCQIPVLIMPPRPVLVPGQPHQRHAKRSARQACAEVDFSDPAEPAGFRWQLVKIRPASSISLQAVEGFQSRAMAADL
jgi:hypothetical protein